MVEAASSAQLRSIQYSTGTLHSRLPKTFRADCDAYCKAIQTALVETLGSYLKTKRKMATYSQIQKHAKQTHNFVPKTCWIAHCKELAGLSVKVSANRNDVNKRMVPCDDPNKREAIFAAFRHFEMIK